MSVRYFSTPDLNAGRQTFALGLLAKTLPDDAPAELKAHAEAAHAAARRWFKVDQAFQQARKEAGRRGDAQQIDRAVDAALAQVARICAALASLGDDHPQGRAAAAFQAKFFPDGVAAVIHINFEDELELVEGMLPEFEAQPAADWIAALPIDGLLAEVRSLAPAYRVELERLSAEVTADDVRAARDVARAAMERVIAGVRYTFDDEKTQSQVLEALTVQVRRFRALRRKSRVVPDVDPQTGVEAPADAPSPPVEGDPIA